MKGLRYYISVLMAVALLVSCRKYDYEGQDLEYCVRAAWQNGLCDSRTTRALAATDILSNTNTDIVISTNDYPSTIDVHCSDGNDFVLTKGVRMCKNHPGYWSYSSTELYKDQMLLDHDLEFTATAVVDATNTVPELGDIVTGVFDYQDIQGGHILLTLHHTKALLRFAFKVSNKYDKIRYIKVTGITLNGAECTLVDNIITQENQYIAYAYIDPSVVTISRENTLVCTYNIYDKDDSTAGHITRQDVVAQNRFKLNSLRDQSSNPVTRIMAGYYYDLKVTINPDYLYVLSEHDNKHITIE